MYMLSKSVIAKYVRGQCKRRLRLDLYSGDKARADGGAPDKDSQRPGTDLLSKEGRRFERRCFRELEEIFGQNVLHGGYKHKKVPELREISLVDYIDRLTSGVFLLEAWYEVCDGFKTAHNLADLCSGAAFSYQGASLRFAKCRPDIILGVAADGKTRGTIDCRGNIVEIPSSDVRVGLRIIDIKITAEPSPAYFAELAYYGMTLADWLATNGHADRFVVLGDA